MSKQPAAPVDSRRPKGILKKTSKYDEPRSPAAAAAAALSSSPQRPMTDRARELALQHARIAQDNREAPLRVLAALEELVEYPSAATKDPADPAPADARAFKAKLRDFKQSDYDDLIEERNINGKCGYALCPRPRRAEKGRAKFRIVTGGGDFRVVDRKDLERWCSDACAEHALFIKLQLDESSVWERRGGHEEVQLRGEAAKPVANAEVRELSEDIQKLAVERGESSVSSLKSDLVMTEVQERDTTSSRADPPAPDSSHGAVDGYVPTASGEHREQNQRRPTLVEMLERAGLGDDSDDDIMDVI